MKRIYKTVFILVSLSATISTGLSQILDHSNDAQLAHKYRDANTAVVRARDAFARKDYARAKSEATAILEKMPEFSEANFIMAKVSYIEKNYITALDFMEKAKTTYMATLKLSSKMEQDRLAAMRKRRDEQDGPIADLKGELARAATDQQRQEIQGRIDRAERIRADLDRVLNEAPVRTIEETPPPEYFFFHGNIYLRLGRAQEAAQQYTEALRLNPSYADAANNLASLYYSAKQYEKALDVLQQVETKGAAVNPGLKKAVMDALGKS